MSFFVLEYVIICIQFDYHAIIDHPLYKLSLHIVL